MSFTTIIKTKTGDEIKFTSECYFVGLYTVISVNGSQDSQGSNKDGSYAGAKRWHDGIRAKALSNGDEIILSPSIPKEYEEDQLKKRFPQRCTIRTSRGTEEILASKEEVKYNDFVTLIAHLPQTEYTRGTSTPTYTDEGLLVTWKETGQLIRGYHYLEDPLAKGAIKEAFKRAAEFLDTLKDRLPEEYEKMKLEPVEIE